MLSAILGLFRHTDKTIQSLLNAQDRVRSNLTLWLVAWSFVPMMLITLKWSWEQTGTSLPSWIWGLSLILIPISLYISRFFFVVLVKLGLMMVANAQYPRDKQDRKNRSRALKWMYPYHIAPVIASNLVWPLIFYPRPVSSAQLLTSFLLYVCYYIFSIGIMVFTIVLMIKIIKRIYGVSTAQAFWGPILAYFILAVILAIIAGMVEILILVATSAFS